jgi:hypothetical protein
VCVCVVCSTSSIFASAVAVGLPRRGGRDLGALASERTEGDRSLPRTDPDLT